MKISRFIVLTYLATAFALFGSIGLIKTCVAEERKQCRSQTLIIRGDKTEYSEAMLFYYACGHAKARIQGQNSSLEADAIRYSDLDKMLDARGNVRIMRNGQLTTGAAFKFRINSNEYLITEGHDAVGKIELKAKN